jgi:VIT1/CCC1 family predicted Fe2+/Mn2+ transporter
LINRNHIQNTITGLSDGLMVPFALAVGLNMNVESKYVTVICLIASVAGALTMSAGAFLTAREYEPSQSAMKAALVIGISYLLGGLICIGPFLLFPESGNLIKLSAFATLPLLFATGVAEHVLHGVNAWMGGLRLLVTGSLVAGCAFFIARLFLSA